MIEDPFTHNSARPSVKVSIEGFVSLALFDSGAKITAMSKSIFEKISHYLSEKGLALKSVDINPTYVISASSHKALVTKAFLVPFVIEGTYRSWKVYVLENLSSDIILGQDFLSFYDAKLCCRTHRITWGKPLKRVPPPEYCLVDIPRLNNRFLPLAALSPPQTYEPVVHKFEESQRKKRYREKTFLNSIRFAKRSCVAAMSEEEQSYVLSVRDHTIVPPMTSKLIKVYLSSIGSRSKPISRKTIGTIETDPILSNKNDVLCLEGLNYAVPTKDGAFTHIQLTNVSTNYAFYEPNETVAAFSPLIRGSELYDISVLKATTSSPLPVLPASKEKEEYLNQSVKIQAPTEYINAYRTLIMKFHDVFASSKDDIGHTDLVTHRIHLKDKNQAPIYRKQFPIPWAHQEFIHKKVEDMLRQGIIEESHSPYNSPVFAVRKPHSTDMRLIIDLRGINAVSHCTNFRVRCVQECVDEISKHESSIFSTLDISSAFYQISLDPQSRPLTGFTIPGKGSYMFTRLPMGLHGSPASLSRVTNFIVRDLPSIIAYLDDLIAHSKDHSTHLDLLHQLFLRLRQYGLKLQAKKTVLGASSVVYLGYRLSKSKIQPGEEKVEAIKKFPPPQSVKQIRQFCGLANYFRHMIPRFSLKSSQLTKLIQKNSNWKAGPLPPESLAAFRQLQKDLTSFPVLTFPDPRKTFHVFTDGAIGGEREPGGLGAVLCQKNEKGILHPVAYASRSLQNNEKNYSAFLIEMSAIVFAIQHWHTYLYGRFFYVHCDHKPIEKLSTVHKKTMNRLQELMLEYNFELKYNPGSNNGPADALSRNPITALGTDIDIPLAQLEDPFCDAMIKYISSGKIPLDPSLRILILRNAKNCMIHSNGTLLYNLRREKFLPKVLTVVPLSFQQPLIRAAHCSRLSGHLGVFKTVNRLYMNYWWPGMQEQVVGFIKECVTCQLSKTPPNFKREVLPSQPLPILDAFNQRVHIDTIGKMRGTKNPWLLVMTCAFSKYVVAVPISKRDAETQAQAIFEHWVCRFGAPKTIVHDGDPAYCGELFQKLCKLLGTKTIQISSYHCQSNGGVEVYNKVFQGILRSMLDSPTEPYEPWLPMVSLAYNSSVNQATNSSPFFLLYGCDPNLPQFEELEISPYNFDFPAERLAQLRHAHNLAKQQLKAAAEKNKKYYDRFAKECAFQLGERCLLHFPRTVCLQGHSKFFKPWHPVVVTRILNHTTYTVKKLGRGRAKRELMVHANRLKKFFPIEILPGYSQSSSTQGGDHTSNPPQSSPCLRGSSANTAVKSSRPLQLDTDNYHRPFAASPALVVPRNDEEGEQEDDQGFVRLPLPHLSSSGSDSSFASLDPDAPSPPRAAATGGPGQASQAAAAAEGSPSEGEASAKGTGSAEGTSSAPAAAAAGVERRTHSGPAHRPPPPPGPVAVRDSGPSSKASSTGRPGLKSQASSVLGPIAEGLYGPRRSTRSNSTAPAIPPLPKRPQEYKSTRGKK